MGVENIERRAWELVRPTGIEPVLRVPETLVISFSLRARGKISITVEKVSQRDLPQPISELVTSFDG